MRSVRMIVYRFISGQNCGVGTAIKILDREPLPAEEEASLECVYVSYNVYEDEVTRERKWKEKIAVS
jgi:hypothetical protein